MNCSAMSSDGHLRILVGDTNDAQITDAENGNILTTLKGHRDNIFSCAWSTNGRYVATGSQDATVLIWDARNWNMPLKRLNSVMSCARSLHFADSGALVAAESDDVVSIFGRQNFDLRQDIRFFGSIAGVALPNGGSEIVVANIDKTVGGILSFQQTPQGLNGGTYGLRVSKDALDFQDARRQIQIDIIQFWTAHQI